jgi:hypothetical protein
MMSTDYADQIVVTLASGASGPGHICDLKNVRGGDTGFPVQLVKEEDTERIVLRAINEGGFACTDIDLFDLIDWLHRMAPEGVDVDAIARALSLLATRQGAP